MKNKTMFYYIIAITALVVITVSSFAYFYSEITGTSSSSSLTTATIGRVEYITNNPSPNDNIFPGWEGTGTTSVYFVSNSDVDVYYQCTVALADDSIENNVYVRALSGADGALTSETKVTREGVVVSSGKLDAESNIVAPLTGTKHNVSYTLIYREQGSAQNEEQGLYIKTYTTCTLQNDKFSAISLVSGQALDLSGDPIANQAMVIYSTPRYFETDENGYYSVFLEEGEHSVYYVPGYTLEQTRNAGESIKTNSETVSKSVTITTQEVDETNQVEKDIVFNINAPVRTISVTCNNCSVDENSKTVTMGEDAQFTITRDNGYTTTNAIVTGGCSLSGSTLTYSNVQEDSECTITLQAKGITCSSGKYLPANSETCENCTAGNYCSGWSGTYDALEHGLSACSDLGSSYTSDAGAISSNSCYIIVAGGKYKTSAYELSTADCVKGSYTTEHKSYYGLSDSCTACAGGKTNSGAGQTSCTSNCSNSSNVNSWKTPSWSNNTVSNLCAAASCSGGYSISGNNCEASDYYVYWGANEGGSNTSYSSSSKPSTTYTSFSSVSTDAMVRTTVRGTTAIKHEACLRYNSKLFCLDANYSTGDKTQDATKIVNGMNSAYGVSTTKASYTNGQTYGRPSGSGSYSCSARATKDYARCTYKSSGGFCHVKSDGSVYCKS